MFADAEGEGVAGPTPVASLTPNKASFRLPIPTGEGQEQPITTGKSSLTSVMLSSKWQTDGSTFNKVQISGSFFGIRLVILTVLNTMQIFKINSKYQVIRRVQSALDATCEHLCRKEVWFFMPR